MTATLLDTPRTRPVVGQRPRVGRPSQIRHRTGHAHACCSTPATDRRRVTFVEQPPAQVSERRMAALLVVIAVLAVAAVVTIASRWLAVTAEPTDIVGTQSAPIVTIEHR